MIRVSSKVSFFSLLSFSLLSISLVVQVDRRVKLCQTDILKTNEWVASIIIDGDRTVDSFVHEYNIMKLSIFWQIKICFFSSGFVLRFVDYKAWIFNFIERFFFCSEHVLIPDLLWAWIKHTVTTAVSWTLVFMCHVECCISNDLFFFHTIQNIGLHW